MKVGDRVLTSSGMGTIVDIRPTGLVKVKLDNDDRIHGYHPDSILEYMNLK